MSDLEKDVLGVAQSAAPSVLTAGSLLPRILALESFMAKYGPILDELEPILKDLKSLL